MDPNKEQCLVEEREETMMIGESKEPYQRKGWFLKPHEYRNLGVPYFPSVKRPSSDLLSTQAPKVTFKGWPNPQPNYEQWVEKLRLIHEGIWKKAGIFDAIQVSTYKIRRDFASLWEIAQYWSYQTNTFIFPFCEATVTLEDVMILGGYSPLGFCVRGAESLTGELEELNIRLVREQRSFNRTKAKKACFSAWMNHFMECDDGLIEHIAFLSLWLSKYVFPRAPGEVIQKELFPIAILMAQGERFALGPAVLASLYRDMRLLKEHLTSSEAVPLFLFAPFPILQMWVWEHFLSLRQNFSPKSIGHNKPWATRWHDSAIKKIQYSGFIVQSLQNLQWRPYANKLDNWSGRWVSCKNVNDEGLVSFAQCLRDCELVGFDGMQLYLPHRVSRQFGYDQDLLGCPRIDFRISDWEVAWALYEKDTMNFTLYIPPRQFESEATYEYYSWWKANTSISSHPEFDVATMEIERKEIVIPSPKKQKLPTDFSITPLVLKGTPFEFDPHVRSNIRIIKGIARTRKASSCAASAQNLLPHYADEGEEEKSQDGFHGLGYGAINSTPEVQGCHKPQRPEKLTFRRSRKTHVTKNKEVNLQ